jgi:hypothetical protein
MKKKFSARLATAIPISVKSKQNGPDTIVLQGELIIASGPE